MDSLCTHADTRSRFRCSEEFAKADYAERSVRVPWHHRALPILYGHLKEELAATCLLVHWPWSPLTLRLYITICGKSDISLAWTWASEVVSIH